jgi:hypothetical protein
MSADRLFEKARFVALDELVFAVVAVALKRQLKTHTSVSNQPFGDIDDRMASPRR